MTIENTILVMQCMWKMFYLWAWAPTVFLIFYFIYEKKLEGDKDGFRS